MANWDGALNNGAFLRLGVDQVSQDINGNYSTDTWILVMARGSNTASWTGAAIPWNVNVNGNAYSGTFSFDFRSADSVVIASGSFNVGHNADGTKTIGVSASIGDTGTAVGGPVGASGSFAQTTIPRASKITLSNNDFAAAGGTFTINTNRASSNFTHDVDYFFGSLSGRAVTNIGASGTWTVPLAFLNQMTNATVAYGTFRTNTYSPTGFVGSTDKVFGVTADGSIVPVVTGITISEATTGVAAIIGAGAFVQAVSKLALTITGAAGVYGSTITGYKLEVAGQTINAASGTTNPITTAGATVPVKATVTDSRGRTASITVNIKVLAYAPPTITQASLQRALIGGAPNEEGTYIRVNLQVSAVSLINGAEKNAMGIRIFIRARGATSWGTAVYNATQAGLAYTNFMVFGTYSITSAWEVLVEVYDRFATSALQGAVATARVVMHWGGINEGTGVGKFWERGGLDVLGEIYHRDGKIVEPTGMLAPFAGTSTPTGWILCDGGAYSRTTYAALFAVIGTQFGTGDGSTTFNVPNLKGRTIVGIDGAQTEFDVRGEVGGAKTHTLDATQMPSHNHAIVRSASSGAQAMVEVATSGEGSATNRRVLADGAAQLVTQNAGSGGAHNNLQPYMALYYIIKA